MIDEKLIKIQSNTLEVSRGDILVAEPFLNDSYFERGVVLMIDHNDKDGSFGIMLNKRLRLSINEMIKNFPQFDADVFLGGPVNTDQVFFIHTLGDKVPRSTDLGNGLYWGGNLYALKPMIQNDMIKPHEVRFFLGHSGWETTQLRSELKLNSWVVAKNITGKDIMTTEAEMMWSKYANIASENHRLWSMFPLDPMEN